MYAVDTESMAQYIDGDLGAYSNDGFAHPSSGIEALSMNVQSLRGAAKFKNGKVIGPKRQRHNVFLPKVNVALFYSSLRNGGHI